jgi:type IV pilus assembly protein PilE
MSSSRGFTIIEVMIVVAIVAILASVALPQYTDYVTRSKIQEATSALLAQRVKMEQYFQDARTYVNACNAGTVATPPTGLKNFSITCNPAPTASTYTIRADGIASMTGFVFTIDQGNNRVTVGVPTGWTLPSGNCWVTKKSGTC